MPCGGRQVTQERVRRKGRGAGGPAAAAEMAASKPRASQRARWRRTRKRHNHRTEDEANCLEHSAAKSNVTPQRAGRAGRTDRRAPELAMASFSRDKGDDSPRFWCGCWRGGLLPRSRPEAGRTQHICKTHPTLNSVGQSPNRAGTEHNMVEPNPNPIGCQTQS